MKHTVIAQIDDCYNIDRSYLKYMANLSKDFNLKLKLMATTPKLEPVYEPVAITGQGLAYPNSLLESKVFDVKKENLETAVEFIKSIHDNVSYNLIYGTAEDLFETKEYSRDSLLWLVNLKSKDGFFNEFFGTFETEFSKSTRLPCLNIPEGYEFKKPKDLLIVLRNISVANLSHLKRVVDAFSLNANYLIHEDDKINSLNEVSDIINGSFTDFKGKIHKVSADLNQDEIESIVSADNPDMVAYVNYDKPFLQRLFEPSTNSLMLNSKRPTLIL